MRAAAPWAVDWRRAHSQPGDDVGGDRGVRRSRRTASRGGTGATRGRARAGTAAWPTTGDRASAGPGRPPCATGRVAGHGRAGGEPAGHTAAFGRAPHHAAASARAPSSSQVASTQRRNAASEGGSRRSLDQATAMIRGGGAGSRATRRMAGSSRSMVSRGTRAKPRPGPDAALDGGVVVGLEHEAGARCQWRSTPPAASGRWSCGSRSAGGRRSPTVAMEAAGRLGGAGRGDEHERVDEHLAEASRARPASAARRR